MTAVDGAREGSTLTLPEAVAATGTSESTIRRRLREQAFPGAVRDARGGWRVPVVDLRAAGFTVTGPLVEATPAATPPTPAPEPIPQAAAEPNPDVAGERARRDDELAELRDLRRQNADLRERVGRAEATADARGVEVERLLHVLDRLSRAVGGVPDDEPQRVVVHDAITADDVDERPKVVDDPVVEVPDEAADEQVDPVLETPADEPQTETTTPRRRWWPFGRS